VLYRYFFGIKNEKRIISNGFFIKNKKLKNNRYSALDAKSAGRKSAIPGGSYCLGKRKKIIYPK